MPQLSREVKMHQINNFVVVTEGGEAAIFISAKDTTKAINQINNVSWSSELKGLVLEAGEENFLLSNAASSKRLAGFSEIVIVLTSIEGQIVFEEKFTVAPI